MRLAVVGSIAYDHVKSPFGEHADLLGGSATYSSIAARRFADVAVVAVVGDDFQDAHWRLFRERGVDIRDVASVAGGQTFRWAGEYAPDFTSRHTLATHLNVFADFAPALGESCKSAELLFLANIAPELQLNVLAQAKAPRFVALDTMNYWITTRREALLDVLKRVDMLLINDEESHLLSGLRNIHAASEKILALGPKTLVIKRGEHGANLYTDGRAFILPAYPTRHVIDPTGAGDSFAGGFLGFLAQHERFDFEALKMAMVMGTLVASFTVEDFSVGRLLTLDDEAWQKRRSRFADITQWVRQA